MKTLIAAVIASAVSFGAFAQPSSPASGASAPMAKPMASSPDTMKKAPAHKATKRHAAKRSMKKASAPAA